MIAPPSVPEPKRSAPFVFYGGCNPLKTPHLLFNTMTVLDAIGIDYAFAGGPSACCGVIAAKWEGQVDQGGHDGGGADVDRDTEASRTPQRRGDLAAAVGVHLDQGAGRDIGHLDADAGLGGMLAGVMLAMQGLPLGDEDDDQEEN